jgi:hypothetical protein
LDEPRGLGEVYPDLLRRDEDLLEEIAIPLVEPSFDGFGERQISAEDRG